MTEFSTLELGTTVVQAEPSALERSALKVFRCIPGMRGLAPSRRVIVAMRGSAWPRVGYVASQVLWLASTLVLARVLFPQAFGLVPLGNVALSRLERPSDRGIGIDAFA